MLNGSSWTELVCRRETRTGCRGDVTEAARDLFLSFSWIFVLIYVCRTRKHHVVNTPVIRYALHDLRWSSALTLITVHLTDFGEALLAKTFGLSSCLPLSHAFAVCFSCLYFDRMEVWRCGIHLLWLCPYWIIEIVIVGLRLPPIWTCQLQSDDSCVQALTVRFVTSCARIGLALILLTTDGLTAFQVRKEEGQACSSREFNEASEKVKAESQSDRSPTVDHSLNSVFLPADHSSNRTNCVASLKLSCYRHNESNLASRATFYWLNPLLWSGYKTPLEQQHLGPLPESFKSSRLGRKIREALQTNASLWKCYLSFSWPAVLLGGFLKFGGDLVGYVAPIGIQVIVAYSNSSSNREAVHNYIYYPSVDEFLSNGYIMAAIIFLSSFLQGALSQASSHVLCVEGIRLKTALQSFLYDKSLRLSSLSGVTPGDEALNESIDGDDQKALQLDAGTFSQLLTEDCGNVMVLLCLCHYIWAIPVKLAILLYLLHKSLGPGSVIAALLCLLLMVPAQFLLGKKISRKNKESMREADRRLAKIHEWLANMKLFRLYAWEKVGMKRIEEVRDRELGHLWAYSLQWAWATFLTQASTVALTLLTFVLYPFFSSESVPAAADALSGLALINQFTVPLTIIPVIVPDLIAAYISTSRLQEFFLKPEINGQKLLHSIKKASESNPTPPEQLSVRTLENIVEDDECESFEEDSSSDSSTDAEANNLNRGYDYIIKINQATFSWARDSTIETEYHSNEFRLTGINLQVPKRRLTVIVGHVGSGKSSLLMALLGELNLESGSLTWDSSCSDTQVGYVAQKPWLMHASLRDNILFGNAMHPRRYWKVIEACALKQDIEQLRQQDATLIGSRGQNISGGQRARIALARAVYSPATTVLLDDPFSALDPPVAQEVFRNAIQRILLRHGRNVIMTTNQLEYARLADHVVVVESGKILAQGSPDYVASQWPELRIQQPESLHPSKAKDRWNKLRLVTKAWGYVISANKRKEELNESTNHLWKRRSSRLNALAIHMSHDLPLLTDEMMVEDLIPDRLSRDRSYNSSMKSLKTRNSSNGESVPRSFSLKRPIGSFLMRRRPRSRERFNLKRHNTEQEVSLNPLAGEDLLPVRDASGSSGSIVAMDSNTRKPPLFRLYSTPVTSKRNPSFPTSEADANEISAESQKSIDDKSAIGHQEGIRRLLSTASGFSEEMPNDNDVERGLLQDPAAADEERQYGRVPRRLYWLYARSCGFFLTICFFIGSVGWQSARLGTDYFLVVYKIETSANQTSINNSNQEGTGSNYLMIYTALSVVSVILALTANILGQAAGNQGRKSLHANLLLSLSECHPRFFDEQPTGRLLNRFSTDMSMIDKKLATAFQRLVQFVLMCLSAIVVNVFITPYSILIAAIIVSVFYVLQRFFRTSARELQRLESLTKAPVVSHLTETLSGLSTLRAFGQQRRFLQTMYEQLDAHTATVLVLNTTNRWLGFALDSLGATAVLAATILALLAPDKITPGQVGLAISYTLMTPIYLQWVVRFWSELEMYFNAVERVLDYSKLPSESEVAQLPGRKNVAHGALNLARNEWPRSGTVEIENLYVAYDHDLEPVLRDLTLSVRHGTKVGICGRTGSGKSTLVNAIFRLAFTTSGVIKLDGVDISSLEPHYLRSRLSVLPQDTLVLAGTLRDNLDPERRKDDTDLWSVLEAVHLKETFRSTGLDSDLWKGGSCRLSVGQQQLLCLARAALRPSPLLILDEPSSALDAEAEQTLYRCLDTLFNDRTILLVAHRLSTLRRCDLVCVMKDGQLETQGPPDQILNNLRIDE